MPNDREPPNLPALVRALAQAGVAYVVSGSTAALLHGVDVAPGDLDIVPALDTTNLERLRAALDAVDARPDPDGPFGSWVQDATGEHRWVEHEPGPGERAARHDWRPDPGDPSTFDEQLVTRFGALDIVPAVSGSYRDLANRASRLHAFDADLLVASIADLLAVLTVARRPKDVPRVAGLRAIQVRSSAGPSRRGRYAVGMFPREDTELTHILVVADPARSRAWYADVLGATVEREYGSSVVLRFAGAWLLLVEGGAPTDDKPTVTLEPPPDPDRRDNLFTIRVDDCRATYELLRSRGGEFLTPPVDRGAETRAFLRDLDGHLFEISEYRAG